MLDINVDWQRWKEAGLGLGGWRKCYGILLSSKKYVLYLEVSLDLCSVVELLYPGIHNISSISAWGNTFASFATQIRNQLRGLSFSCFMLINPMCSTILPGNGPLV